MRIVIVGQGAIGLLWHKHFQQGSNNAITVKILTSNGNANNAPKINYFYSHLNGLSEQCYYHSANFDDITTADIILICVKSYQVKAVIADIAPYLTTPTTIILAHNGMGTLLDLPTQLLQQHHFLTLLTTHGCTRPMAKHIIHTGQGVSDLGLLTGHLSKQYSQQLTTLFNQALAQVNWANNIIAKQWQKLAINCVINPLTALHNITNGEINNAQFNQIKIEIINEIVHVAQAEQQYLSAQLLLTNVENVATATAKNCSSMRADVLAKRTTEIDYINGYIQRLGCQHNIATPVNSQLVQQIKQLNA
jgi:2-dehydropantoate 2-reductase